MRYTPLHDDTEWFIEQVRGIGYCEQMDHNPPPSPDAHLEMEDWLWSEGPR